MRRVAAGIVVLIALSVLLIAQFAGSGGGTPVPVANGGSGANLSATGGTDQIVKQNSAGAVFTVGTIACANLSNASASCSTDATNASNLSSGTIPAGRFPTFVTAYPNQQISQIMGTTAGATIATGATQYACPCSTTFGTTAQRETLTSTAGHVGNLAVHILSTQPGTGNLVCAIYINQVASTSTITFPINQTTIILSDTTHFPTVAQFDAIAMGCTNNASGNSAQIANWSFSILP